MLEIKSLAASYKKAQVLSDISLNVGNGELVTLLGENGCGKTTLLKCAIGILEPTKGDILADGTDLTSLSQRERAKRISYLPQERGIPDMTVEALVLHGRFPHLSYPRRYSEEDRRIARSALEALGLSELAHCNLASLSGGMRQKAYIAMALCQNTEHILLDEPTAYLDPRNTLELMSSLRSLASDGKGILAVTHDIQAAMCFSDKVAVMRNGRISAFGTPDGIYSSGIISEIFGIKLMKTDSGYVSVYPETIKNNI